MQPEMSEKGLLAQSAIPALEVNDISKSLPLNRSHIEILHNISLRIEHGEFVAIVGPSGSGKSTLLGIIAGLDTPTSGQVFLDGVDITHLREDALAKIRNAKVGMVYQAFNLIPTLTAQENVEAPLYISTSQHSRRPDIRARQMLEQVGLGHRLHHRPGQLSGGEQQRVAIARALVLDPAFVIMDEPTGNLDRANGEQVLAMIQTLQKQTHISFVIATHDPNVAAASGRVIHLVDGRIA